MNQITIKETAAFLMAHDRYLILTHLRPDGDTIGCATGLCHALREQGKTAWVLENSEATELFTPYFQGLLAPDDVQPDVVISVDIAARSLFPANAQLWLERGVDLAIDHHPSQEFFAKQTCLDATSAACGELVYDVICHFGTITQQIALPLYVAISTDCGCFAYGNTTAKTHRVVANLMDTGIDVYPINHKHFRTKSFTRLKIEGMMVSAMDSFDDGTIAIVSLSLDMLAQVSAREEDVEDISAFVGQIEGVKTGVTIRELPTGGCKISLRTDPGDLNASSVCALLGGGGHAAAAGATIMGTVRQTKTIVMDAIRTVQGRGGI